MLTQYKDKFMGYYMIPESDFRGNVHDEVLRILKECKGYILMYLDTTYDLGGNYWLLTKEDNY